MQKGTKESEIKILAFKTESDRIYKKLKEGRSCQEFLDATRHQGVLKLIPYNKYF